MNTRHEVLYDESLIPPTLSENGCMVVAGKWYDIYTGTTYTNPKELEVDHFIPLHEAHISGGSTWDKQKKQAFANNMKHAWHLIAVSAQANRRKSAQDPAQWLPPNKEIHCKYVTQWLQIKNEWGLDFDVAERQFIQSFLENCPEQ